MCILYVFHIVILETEPNERDMIIVHNIIDVEWPDGSQQRRISNITDYGILNGYSAMSRSTGLPTAMATESILNGMFTVVSTMVYWCLRPLAIIFQLYCGGHVFLLVNATYMKTRQKINYLPKSLTHFLVYSIEHTAPWSQIT
jgi:hypothetical protein